MLTMIAARSIEAFARWVRFSATSILKRDLIPSSLLFMMAAFAASSVVGGSTCGVDVPPRPGVIGRDVDSVIAAV